MKKVDRWLNQHPFIMTLINMGSYFVVGGLVQRPVSLMDWKELVTGSLIIGIMIGLPRLVPATWSYVKVFIISLGGFIFFSSIDGFLLSKDADDSSALIIYLGFGLIFSLVILVLTFLQRNRKIIRP